MPCSIEIYFDAETELRIRGLWEEFAAIGASFMRDSAARPHVTLAVCESVDVPGARLLLDRLAGEMSCFSMTLSSLGVFANAESVAFLAPKVTSELLALHARFFAEFATVARDCWSDYSPAHWVPHCTLALGLGLHQMGRAVEIVRAAGLPILGTVSAIGLVESGPVRPLHFAPLASARKA